MRDISMSKTGNASGCGHAQGCEMSAPRSTAGNSQAAARFRSLVEERTREYCAREDQDAAQEQSTIFAQPMPIPVPCTALAEGKGGNPLPPGVSHPGAPARGIASVEMRHCTGGADAPDCLPAPVGTQRQFTLFPNGAGNLTALAIKFQLDASTVTASFQDLSASQLRAMHARKPGLKAALRVQFGRKAEIEMSSAAEESEYGP
jgi:hypothetical protein